MGDHGVGAPAATLLDIFGRMIFDVFGEYPYQVGSSNQTTQWRDVDVRVMLDDEVYNAQYGDPNSTIPNRKRLLTELAFSLLGQKITGLPIDFQIQQHSHANEHYKGRRNCLIGWGDFVENDV